MNKIYLDTNIFIDLIKMRSPKTQAFIDLLRSNDLDNFHISALSVHIAYYSLKVKPNTQDAQDIKDIVNTLTVVNLSNDIVRRAMEVGYKDFEDCLQYISAIESGCDTLITRDTKDFIPIQDILKGSIDIVTL